MIAPPRPLFSFLLSTLLALFSTVTMVTVAAGESGPPDRLAVALSWFGPDHRADPVLMEKTARRIGDGAREIARSIDADSAAVADRLRQSILENLDEKRKLKAPDLGRFPLTPDEIERTVVGYEIFKMKTYLSSGVFPKRYFGFFDGKWDTAEEEKVLLSLTGEVVEAINERRALDGGEVRLTDLEVLVTYISEGGALFFLGEKSKIQPPDKKSIHLFIDHGCDNIGLAVERYFSLTRYLDERFGTEIAGSGEEEGLNEIGETWHGIGKKVTYRESIVANALMVLFEKENAARKLRSRAAEEGSEGGWRSGRMADYTMREQFILTSLVFNTGSLFSWSWIESIRDFSGLERLHAVSEKNAAKRGSEWRRRLPIDPSSEAAFGRLTEWGYREQPTSWQGAYHILQRYGAFVALQQFTDLFDEEGDWKGR